MTAGYLRNKSETRHIANESSVIASKQRVMLMLRIGIRACIAVFPLCLFLNGAIKHIVLGDEDDVKQQTDVCQAKLDRVARQTAPVCLQRAVDE